MSEKVRTFCASHYTREWTISNFPKLESLFGSFQSAAITLDRFKSAMAAGIINLSLAVLVSLAKLSKIAEYLILYTYLKLNGEETDPLLAETK